MLYLRVINIPVAGIEIEIGIDDIHWQKGFHDERIRDRRQFDTAMKYVRYNAWRHGLVNNPDGWPWSSLSFPHLMDDRGSW